MQEMDRLRVIRSVVAGEMKPQVAALRLGLCTRQLRRLVARYRERGAVGLVSGHRGRASNRQLPPEMIEEARSILRERYADFGPTFACEKLREYHGLMLSKETVRQIMKAQGLWVTRRQTQAALHQPRECRPCRGELVQIDGSRHAWFGKRGEPCTLLVYVDDATGCMLQLYFAVTESTTGYFEATRGYLAQHGKPQTFYADMAAIFRNPKDEHAAATQFKRALDTLDINLICAGSAQAKGRVERMNRTLQDRLVKEMRLRGISTIADANAWISWFIADYNRRFERVPRDPWDRHTPVRKDECLERILSLQVPRKLTAKLTFQHDGLLYLVADTPANRAMARQTIMVHEHPDGQIEVCAGDVTLAYTTLPVAGSQRQPRVADSKSLDYVLQQLQGEKKKRLRAYRNPGPAEITEGVVAAKKMAAIKAGKPRHK